MRDFLGVEIAVGNKVVYSLNKAGASFLKGTVTKINEKTVTIVRFPEFQDKWRQQRTVQPFNGVIVIDK